MALSAGDGSKPFDLSAGYGAEVQQGSKVKVATFCYILAGPIKMSVLCKAALKRQATDMHTAGAAAGAGAFRLPL